MTILLILYIFIFGVIIGSFLNVAALRYNSGRSIGGRSSCFSCLATLKWYELIPLVSFISTRGRCRTCRSKISWQYPLVEFITGVVFVALFYPLLKTGVVISTIELVKAIFWAVQFSILIVITVYDFRHKIIPDGLVYAFSILAVLGIIFFGPVTFTAFIAGPLLFAPFFLLWLISRGTWIGLGDAKLALGIGFSLGIIHGISAIILGFWIGAVVSILMLAFGGKKLTIKSEIPFGPFLVLGFLLIFFFRWDIMNLQTLFLIMN